MSPYMAPISAALLLHANKLLFLPSALRPPLSFKPQAVTLTGCFANMKEVQVRGKDFHCFTASNGTT